MWAASARELVGASEPARERDRRAERLAGLVGQRRRAAACRTCPARSCTTRMPDGREVARRRQRHADDRALRGRVGDLADLAVEGRDRGGVDAHAALADPVGSFAHHRRGGQPQHVEGADQVDRGSRSRTARARAAPRLPATRSAQPMPAQQTAIRSPPGCAAAARRPPATASCVGHVGRARTMAALAELAGQRLAALSFRSAITTWAPRACSARAVASPSPEAPPATSAPLPSICIGREPYARAARQRQREQLVGVGVPRLAARGPAASKSALHARARELGADLGAQLLAGGEARPAGRGRAISTRARPPRAQAHLDPLVRAVEERDVLERLGVEVGVELAVDHVQHVAVELGGDALRSRRRRPRSRPGP